MTPTRPTTRVPRAGGGLASERNSLAVISDECASFVHAHEPARPVIAHEHPSLVIPHERSEDAGSGDTSRRAQVHTVADPGSPQPSGMTTQEAATTGAPS